MCAVWYTGGMRTVGISPKLWPPLVAALSVALEGYISTGAVDRQSLAALAVAAVGLAGAYLAPPGETAASR